MNHKTRMFIMAGIWLLLGGYAWYLFTKHEGGGRMYFAMMVVAIGMAAANVMRALYRR